MFGINEIWILLGVPALITLWLLVAHRKATKWWELLIIWSTAIVSIAVSQVIVEQISISDREIWGYNAVQATYEEPYQYWTTCSETYACGESCSGSGSNRTCSTNYCTRYYPCKEWSGDVATLINQKGGKRRISKARYRKLEEEQWANSKTIELHREKKLDIVVDGDLRVTKWPGTWQTAEPIAEEHTYENRTIRSTTVRFQDVGEKEVKQYGLFEYPTFYGGYEVQTVIDGTGRYWRVPDQRFRYVNGVLGPKRFLRIWVLIFRDQPREAMHYQEGYWYNGNKNEFIICIGADKDGNVNWGGVISWTEVEELKVEFRDYVENKMGKVTDDTLLALAEVAEVELGKRYIKPEFTDKFHHLAIRPSTTSMVVVALIIILINGLVAWWVVKNDFYEVDPDTFPRRPKRPIRPPSPRGRRRYR